MSREADLRKMFLSSTESQENLREGVWSRYMGLPNAQRTMVYKPAQNLCPTGFQFQSNEEIGVPASRPVFLDGTIAQGADINIVQYLGIAADEPERIARHSIKSDIKLPLVEMGWDEAYCRKWCADNNLLSPIYTEAQRGGCWFCHNQGVDQLRKLRKNYPDLWQILLKWDLDSPVSFKPGGITVHHFDKRFELEDKGLVPTDRKFRWKMLDEYNEQPDENPAVFNLNKKE